MRSVYVHIIILFIIKGWICVSVKVDICMCISGAQVRTEKGAEKMMLLIVTWYKTADKK